MESTPKSCTWAWAPWAFANDEKPQKGPEHTVKGTVVLWVAEPVPVTVNVKVPVGVVDVVLMVRTEEPPDVTDTGAKPEVAPDGRPLTLRLTTCAEPVTEVVTMKVAGLPRVTPCEDGETPIPKSVGALKLADTVIGPLMTTLWGVTVPVRLPEKPTKLSPLDAVAAIEITVPASY